MCLSQEMADQLAPQFAKSHWVALSDARKTYCAAPATTRGVPHNLVPGIHACLDEYVDALHTMRKRTGREDSTCVDSLLVLPFSPWSQALPPAVEATTDLSTRLCVRDPRALSAAAGCAYLPDHTRKAAAIVHNSLCPDHSPVGQRNNPFAGSTREVEVFFNIANAVVLMSRVAIMEHADARGRPATVVLAERVDAWVNGGPDSELPSGSVCADVLLMLSMMYPQNFRVADDVVHPAWAAAVPAMQRHLHRSEHTTPAFGALGLPSALVQEGRRWWGAFVRARGPVWVDLRGQRGELGPLGVLLTLLDDHDGSHDVTLEQFTRVREALNDSVRAAWLVASPDGERAPPENHPAARAQTPEGVRGPMIDPVFVSDIDRGLEQRGCLVGLKPHQFRQVCALALGARLDGVECNVRRNEGRRRNDEHGCCVHR